MPAQDGGICRIRLPGGRLTLAQASILADAAARFGSGTIEITNRANVQLRGIDASRHAALVDCLIAAGLGPLVPGADDVRNLLLSPTAGIDADALLDVNPLATQVLELLQARAELHRLAPKFALQLDGGEGVAMLEHRHDIWLAALPAGDELAFGLAGCAPLHADDAPALAALPIVRALEFIEAALQLFLDCAQPGQTRMRQLLETMSAAEFLQRLQARLTFRLRADAALANWRRTPPRAAAHIGIHAQSGCEHHYVGAVPVLGRLDSGTLRKLAQLAGKYRGELRCTPWQSVLVANVDAQDAASLARELAALGLSCDPAAVIAHTIACSGAPGCAKSLANTKLDARALSNVAQQHFAAQARSDAPPSIHVTGCARSCAAAHCAAFTLLAQAPGRYTLYQRKEGAERSSRFGHMLAQSVDVNTAGAMIAACFDVDSNPNLDAGNP